MDLIKKYQARAAAEGVDPLGYYMPVWAYAYLQVLGDAIEATKTLDDAKLADYIKKTKFKTVVGDVAFGPDGEMGGRTYAGGPIPEREGQRYRAVQDSRYLRGARPAAIQKPATLSILMRKAKP